MKDITDKERTFLVIKHGEQYLTKLHYAYTNGEQLSELEVRAAKLGKFVIDLQEKEMVSIITQKILEEIDKELIDSLRGLTKQDKA